MFFGSSNYAFNDPVALNDPSGADPWWEFGPNGASRLETTTDRWQRTGDANLSTRSRGPRIWNPWAGNQGKDGVYTGGWIPLNSFEGQMFYFNKFGADSRIKIDDSDAGNGGPGDPNPFNFFVDMMKSWLNQFTADNRDELYTTNQNSLRKTNVIVNTLANTQVTPYYTISYSKQFGGAIPGYGSLTYSGGNFYGTVGSDLTLSGPSIGPNFSFSIGLSVGPGSSSPFSIGSSAGYMGMGFEMSGTKRENSLSIGRPFSIGFVISNSSYWVSGNGGYTFQISGNE